MRLASNSPITLAFGATSAPYSEGNPHRGTDFSYIPDNTIYAPFSGKVVLVPNNGNDGNGIYMYNGGEFHGMLHSSKYLVNNGDFVNEGQPIGIMGYSGYVVPKGPGGTHLHWCVKVNGVFIDPLSLVKGDDMADQKQIDDLNARIDLAVSQATAANNRADGLEAELNAERKGYEMQIDDLNRQIADLQKQLSDAGLSDVEKENNSLLKKLLSIFNIK